MKKIVCSLFEKLVCIFFVVIFCQFPSFFDQYQMRLTGHLAESQRVIQTLEKTATVLHTSLPRYIEYCLLSKNEDIYHFGQVMRECVERNEWLMQSRERLQNASVYTKPFLFISAIEGEIFRETIQGFHFQITFTLETLLYAFVGFLCALVVTKVIPWIYCRKSKSRMQDVQESSSHALH